jgi:hypothetical protein
MTFRYVPKAAIHISEIERPLLSGISKVCNVSEAAGHSCKMPAIKRMFANFYFDCRKLALRQQLNLPK